MMAHAAEMPVPGGAVLSAWVCAPWGGPTEPSMSGVIHSGAIAA